MEQVPIHCEAYGGFGDLTGVLMFDGRTLVLKYQTADAFLGVMRSEAMKLEFSLAEVTDVQFGLGWFWLMPVIDVALTNFESLAQLPVKHEGRLRLRVKFAHRHVARRLVDSLAMAAADQRFRRLDDELARMTRPVSSPGPLEAPHAAQATPPPPPMRPELE